MASEIRWTKVTDLPFIVEIEKLSFEDPWNEEDFKSAIKQTNARSFVAADDDGLVAGYVVYERKAGCYHLTNFGVHPFYRRRRIGTVMINRIKRYLAPDARKYMYFHIRERNLKGQLFLKEMGFVAEKIYPNYYDDIGEDSYCMVYITPGSKMDFSPANRITQYYL